ncbi:helix-turn-helix transcriptional regulator [Mucilaginibacter corticis]|uniref:Helix-turn-helix transcriptional regulator n=1 Tax=Mucilaginibacter corticis TaxID=2597670 RepID=A0A556MGI8_9SPHI|nr:helix-turn-helix transcriptional regulator [Mucilaginibacter corticis]TSJ38915.1 helix-turn-helix transcriptional regulator [Mucilaginibacter corticis]
MADYKKIISTVLVNIRKRRGELGYSQEYMALKLHISQNSYSKLELGITKLTVQKFLEISELLQVLPSSLTNDTNYVNEIRHQSKG